MHFALLRCWCVRQGGIAFGAPESHLPVRRINRRRMTGTPKSSIATARSLPHIYLFAVPTAFNLKPPIIVL